MYLYYNELVVFTQVQSSNFEKAGIEAASVLLELFISCLMISFVIMSFLIYIDDCSDSEGERDNDKDDEDKITGSRG